MAYEITFELSNDAHDYDPHESDISGTIRPVRYHSSGVFERAGQDLVLDAFWQTDAVEVVSDIFPVVPIVLWPG